MKQTITLALGLLLGNASAALAQCTPAPSHKGIVTWYDVPPTPRMNCAFPENVLPNLPTIAVGNSNYFGPNMAADLCGTCVEVQGPNGKVVFMVRDRCPECVGDHVDIQKSARLRVANDGYFDKSPNHKVTWKRVPCPISANSPVRFALKSGTNPYWASVQVRNSKYPIKALAILRNGKYVSLQRTQDNYFVVPGDKAPTGGLINKAITFRVTDVNNNSIVEKNIRMQTARGGQPQGSSVGGQHQFPDCKYNRSAASSETAMSAGSEQADAAATAIQQEERGMAMWPNPAENTVQFAWQDFDETPVLLTVVNSQGNVMEQKQIDNLAAYQLSTSRLPDGLYHITLQSGQATTRSRLVIKH